MKVKSAQNFDHSNVYHCPPPLKQLWKRTKEHACMFVNLMINDSTSRSVNILEDWNIAWGRKTWSSPRLYCARMSNSRAWRITVVFCLNFAKSSLTNSTVIVSVFMEKTELSTNFALLFFEDSYWKKTKITKIFPKTKKFYIFSKHYGYLIPQKISGSILLIL